MGSCGLRKPLCSLSANWWGCVSPCSLLDLLRPSTGAYRLLGGARSWLKNGGYQEGSRQWVLPRNTTTSVFIPAVSHIHPTSHTLTGHPAMSAVRSGPGSWGHCFFWCSWHARDLVCILREWSFCFPSSVDFLWADFSGLQSQMLWGLLAKPALHIGEPGVGLRTFTPVGEPLWYTYFPVCASPTQDVILLQMHPTYHPIVASSLSLDIAYAFR